MGSRHVAKDTPAAIKLERDDFIIANDDHEKHANLPDPLSEFDDAVASSGHEIPLPNIFSSPFKNAPLPPVADTFQSPSKAPSQPDEYPLPGTNSPVKPEPLLSVSAPSDIKPSLASPPISVVAMPTLTPSPGKKRHSSHHNALRLKAHQQAQAGGSKKLRCVCEFSHDDGFLVQCNKCYAWQHIDCFYPNASSRPVAHRCHVCVPRYVNVEDAKQIQAKKLDDRRGGGFKLNGHGGMAISIPSALPTSGLGVSMSTAMSASSASGLIATSSVSSSASAKLMNAAKRSLPNSVSSITEATVSRLSSGVTVASVVRRVAASVPLSSPLQYSTGTTSSGVDANRSSKRKQSLQMRSTPDPMLMHTEEESEFEIELQLKLD